MKPFRYSQALVMLLIMTWALFAVCLQALAQDSQELAKASQNPVSSLISVPFENIFNFNAGPEDETDYILNIKPVYPVGISKNWNLINRAIVPVISQGERYQGQGREFGLGDISYQGFLTPAKPGKVIWGVGPMITLPTGSDDRLTSDKWSAGPAFVALAMPGKWVVGGLLYNIWSFAGDDDASDVNTMGFQYFINYNMAHGWYLTTTPTITANWEADSSNTWTIPFGGGVGRVFNIGKQPVNAALRAYYNVEKPDNAPNWSLNFQVVFLFPK